MSERLLRWDCSWAGERCVQLLYNTRARARYFFAAGRGARVEFMKVWLANETKKQYACEQLNTMARKVHGLSPVRV